MKISKVYANDAVLFKDILFNTDNTNFIISDFHSVGKTTLFALIDFLLLKSKKPSFLQKEMFQKKDLIFYIELFLNDNTYLTIERPVFGKSNIRIAEHKTTSDYRNKEDSDFDKKDGLAGILEYLNQNIGLEFALPNFRDYISYFMRDQDNQSDIFRLNKFLRGADINYKPKIAALVGVSMQPVRRKYEIENEIESIEANIKMLEKELENHKTPESIQKIIEIHEIEKASKEEKYKNFDFYLSEHNISKDLVYEIESKISELNEERNSILREIEYIDSTINFPVETSISLNDIDVLFNDISAVFPTELRKNYSQVLEFNKQINSERKEILISNKKDFEKELKGINNKLEDFNEQRKTLLSVLKDTDTMSKFKSLERELIDIETKIKIQKINLDKFKEIENCKQKITELNVEHSDVIKKIKKQKNNPIATLIDEQVKEFSNIIFGEPATFTIGFNGQDNIEFELPIASKGSFENDKEKGNTIRKLLCFVFGAAVLSAYKNDNFVKFLMFDSPFDGDNNHYQKGLWEAIKKLSENGIQTIITTITDEIKDIQIQNEVKSLYTVLELSEENKLLGSF